MKYHSPPSYFNDPPHPITIHLIGCGGTGSQVLNGIARINHAMKAMGHVGIHLTAFDPDRVTESNIGRQLFSPIDIDQNKASVLVTRANNFYGTSWTSKPQTYEQYVETRKTEYQRFANISISCVDTVKARINIDSMLKGASGRDHGQPYYWMDFGNGHQSGQIILGSIGKIKQPESKYELVDQLPNVLQEFPQMKKMKDKDEGPSCSLAQALGRQDLFINSALAQIGCNLIWKLLSEVKIANRGAYLNLETLNVSALKI